MDISKSAGEILTRYIKPYKKIVYVPKAWLRHVIKRYVYVGGQTVVYGYKEDVTRFMHCLPQYCGTIRAKYAEREDWINRPGTEFNNTELIRQIASWQIDQMIIVSEDFRYLLRMYLIGEEVPYKIIDIYEIMKKEYNMTVIRGIAKNQIRNIVYDFLTECTKWGKRIWNVKPIRFCDSYDAILVKKYCFKEAEDRGEKAYYLKELIVNYLMIRDYQNAFLYIDEYVNLFGTKDNSFIQLKQEFMELFSQMKEFLHNKSEKDIIVFWCDALPYEDYKKWHFLEKLEKESLVFENAYTHIPYTHTTSQSMFMGTPYFESKMYRSVETETMIEHGKTFDYLEENHYQICEIGDNYTNKKYIKPDEYYVRSLYPPATMRLWETLAQLLDGEEKKFIICHMDDETHNPYWNGESDRLRVDPGSFLTDISEFEVQRKESVTYLEKQIFYYMDFWVRTHVKFL